MQGEMLQQALLVHQMLGKIQGSKGLLILLTPSSCLQMCSRYHSHAAVVSVGARSKPPRSLLVQQIQHVHLHSAQKMHGNNSWQTNLHSLQHGSIVQLECPSRGVHTAIVTTPRAQHHKFQVSSN